MSRGSLMAIPSFFRALCPSVLVIILFASAAVGQSPPGTVAPGLLNDPTSMVKVSYDTAPGTAVLVFHVYAERTGVKLDRQALLRLVSHAGQMDVWQTTDENAEAIFTNVNLGSYDVEINAVGFLSAHQQASVMSAIHPYEFSIVLHRDPEAVNLNVSTSTMSPKARKEERRAITLLKAGNLAQAQKQLDTAFKLAPTSPDLNFLMGYLYYQKRDLENAGTYLGTATNLNPHNGQALTLLGRTHLERQDYPAARSALEQAILTDAENWVPHSLLADAYLHQKSYDKARDEAQVAIAKGKSASGSAQLVLGQALLGLGKKEEGLQALNIFLKQSPQNPMAGQVRGLIEWVQQQPPLPPPSENSTLAETRIPGIDALAALPAPGLVVKPWQPPGIDDAKPVVSPSVDCPAGQVIVESGMRVQELVDDVARFAAVEDLFHQSLDNYGVPSRTETRKYNYVASISEPESGFLIVDEYRTDKVDFSGYPDGIVSTGFAALALVFHPDMRDNFEMTCEGLGDWQGQATWLVHFRQRDDRPNHMHSYKVGGQTYPVPLKGRAWITPDKFQIVRIEAEMVHPILEIQLASEHQVVEYGPVPFTKKNTTLWLPKSAEIYFDFRKHRYYRRHSFDHYMLYSVETEEKRKVPQVKDISE